MTEPRWRDLESGGALIVCAFTWGDGHTCDQLLARGNRIAPLLRPPKGHHFAKPDEHGVTPLRRNGKPRRPLPDAKQPTDEHDRPMWASKIGPVATGIATKRIIGETLNRPADVRCPDCGQVRHID